MQLTIRVPDDTVAHIDAAIRDGRAANRTAYITAALERQRRRDAEEADLAIVVEYDGDPYPDLAGIAAWTAEQPRPELD
ncbi:MAG: antitoxin [Sporichthyaceae bacterium]